MESRYQSPSIKQFGLSIEDFYNERTTQNTSACGIVSNISGHVFCIIFLQNNSDLLAFGMYCECQILRAFLPHYEYEKFKIYLSYPKHK